MRRMPIKRPHEERTLNAVSISSKADRVLAEARRVADNVSTWADLSLLLFDQESGIVVRFFPSEIERQAFFDSEQYEEINRLLTEVMNRTGVRAGSTPATLNKSGRFNVRVPKSLHHALEVEAKREGVSLNQLAVAKLAVPLQATCAESTILVVRAFADVHDGYAVDRIVADPDYNARFRRRCREFGLEDPDVVLNHSLMNVRKNKALRSKLGIEIPRTTKETKFSGLGKYQFASEIAVRVLQRTQGVSLDRIICDPVLAEEFDRIALALVNETVLKLRWAALNLRKTRKLRPMKALRDDYDLVSHGPMASVNLSALEQVPGLYAFYDSKRPIFAGETDKLRERIELHSRYGIPCLDLDDQSVELKTFTVPGAKQSTTRKSWLLSFITKEHPLLNYQRAA